MSKASNSVLTLMMALAVSAGAAHASETSGASGVSVSGEKSSSYLDLTKNLYVSYFATVHGTPLNNISSPYSLDHNAKNTKSSFNNINLDSDVTAAYMLNKDVGVGLSIPFLLVPVQGQGAILGDVGFKALDKHFISGNGLNISTNIYVQAPTAKASRERGLDFGLKTTPGIRYNIPNSRFAIGSWTEAKWYAGVDYGKTFKLLALPYVNYTLSSSLSLNLSYEIESDHMKNASTFDFTTYQTDLQPGVVWFITPKVMFNPYLQIFTGEKKISADRTALGAVFSATIL